MKYHVLIMPFVAASCLVLHTGEAQNLNLSQSSRETRATRIPFVIYVPDNPGLPTTPKVWQSTNNRGVTTVEIIRSVEVKLDGSNESNVGVASSDNGDLLFSDGDDKNNGKDTSGQSRARNNKNNRTQASSVLLLTPNDTSDKYQEDYIKSEPKRIFHKILTVDGIDFNGRILLGSTLIRKSNNKIEDHKYSYFRDPKVADNMSHTTYINQNSSSGFNKSRINVKFPPKILKNSNSQQNKRKQTSVISNEFSRSQKALYHSRIGKQTKINQNNVQTQKTENANNQNPSEVTPTNIPQAQNKKETLQAPTHWDFGKKTSNSSTDVGSYAPNSGQSVSSSASKNANEFAAELPQLMHPARSTLQSLQVTRPKPIIENVIKTSIGPQVIPQNAFTKHQRVPIYNRINSIQTFPVLRTLNNIKSAQDYQDIHNGNVIREQLGSHAFPNTHVQGYSNDIRRGNTQETNPRIYSYSSEAIAQNNVPVINAGQQSEQQHGVRNNWQSVYFVPHIALQQQQQQQQRQQLPAVFTLQPVITGGATQSIPLIIQQNYPRLYQAAVGPSPAVPSPNGIVYEGKAVLSSTMYQKYKEILVFAFKMFSPKSV
jgi:hypothetical protein